MYCFDGNKFEWGKKKKKKKKNTLHEPDLQVL